MAQAEASGFESQPGFPGKSFFGSSLHSPTKSHSILSCDYLGTRQTDSLDNVVDRDVEQPVIKSLHLHSAAGKGLALRNGVHEEEVVMLPAEARVQLLLHNEDNVSRDDVGALGRESQVATDRFIAYINWPRFCLYMSPGLHLCNGELDPVF